MKKLSVLFGLLIMLYPVFGQIPYEFELSGEMRFLKTVNTAPIGNAVTDLVAKDTVFMGTSRGVSFYYPDSMQWTHFDGSYFDEHEGITALAVNNDGVVWAAVAYDTLIADSYMTAGGGLYYLEPGANNWVHIAQPIDSAQGYDTTAIALPTTTNVLNVTYDIAFRNDEIWIASWGGGVRKSEDNGQTWVPVTVDNKPLDVYSYESHRGFSLLNAHGNMWIGTAGGLGKITSDDTVLYKFNPDGNSISGNWIIGLRKQSSTGWIWAITLAALDAEEYNSISVTPDEGVTWYNFLTDELADGTFPRDIAFSGDSVFVATEKGVFFSRDLGESWNKLGYMTDEVSGDKLLSDEFFSVDVRRTEEGNTFWFGSAQGLVYSSDLLHYTIFRRFVSSEERSKPFTFAYPSPVSPRRGQSTRIQFSLFANATVKVDIYNFAMEKVRSLSENITGVTVDTPDRFLVWDGKDGDGKYVSNGIYFYKLKLNGKVYWGKIMVLN